MGGQIASPGSMHLDLRALNGIARVLAAGSATIGVQAGIRWCDIQRFVDPHGLAVKIMQTYANFTVGGSLSVNVHGRYIGLGPLVLSVRWVKLVLPDGSLVEASPRHNRSCSTARSAATAAWESSLRPSWSSPRNGASSALHKTMPAGEILGPIFATRSATIPRRCSTTPTVCAALLQRARGHLVRDRQAGHHARSAAAARPPTRWNNYFLWAGPETPLGKWRRE